MNRKSILCSFSMLLAAPAFAQDVRFQAGPNGVAMQANLPPDAPRHQGPGHSGQHGPGRPDPQTLEASAEGYRIAFEANPGGATVVKLLAPEGAQCQIWDGKRLIEEDDLPMSFSARPDRFYRIAVKLADGQVLERKLSARRGQTSSFWIEAPPPPQLQAQAAVLEVQVAPPPPSAPPMPAGPTPMYENDFAALKEAIRNEDFAKDQIQVLQTAVAAPSAWFTVDQVGQLVDLFDFGKDKVRTVELVVDRIVDRQNTYRLYSHFDFQGEKEQVKGLLGQ